MGGGWGRGGWGWGGGLSLAEPSSLWRQNKGLPLASVPAFPHLVHQKIHGIGMVEHLRAIGQIPHPSHPYPTPWALWGSASPRGLGVEDESPPQGPEAVGLGEDLGHRTGDHPRRRRRFCRPHLLRHRRRADGAPCPRPRPPARGVNMRPYKDVRKRKVH